MATIRPDPLSGKSQELSWWHDPRLANERRQVFLLGLVVVLGLSLVTVLAIQRARENEKPPPASPAAQPASAQEAPADSLTFRRPQGPDATPPAREPVVSAGILERAAAALVEGDLEACARMLDAAELELIRLRGLRAFQSSNPEAALAFFQQVVTVSPDSVNDWINLATVLASLGRWEEAIEAHTRARQADADNDYAANRYYFALIDAGRTQRASEEIALAIEASPTQSLPQVALPAAVLAFREGRTARAGDFLQAARSLLPPDTFDSLCQEPVMKDTLNALPPPAP